MDGSFKELIFDDLDMKFRVPTGIFVGGSSQSGKTTWILRLLKHYKTMFEPVPQSIVYAYGEKNEDLIRKLEKMNVKTHKGVPTDDYLDSNRKPLLLILDDLLEDINEKWLQSLFTRKSHHRNIAVVFVTQALFDKKLVKSRSNAHYVVLMRAPNSALSIRNFAMQMFADKFKDFLHAYEEATKSQFGYVVVDSHPMSPPELRVRTNIFPDDKENFVYY